jgi:hypothetical protein
MKISRDTNNVTQLTSPPDAAPALPPARQALTTKQAAIVALRAQLHRREKQHAELRALDGKFAELRAAHAGAAEEWQALRARQLYGEAVDPAKMREVEHRRDDLAHQVHQQADEAASMSRVITQLIGELGELAAQLKQHEHELPVFIAAAAREVTLTKLRAGRLKRLIEYVAEDLADIYDGSNVHELLRAQQHTDDMRLHPHLAPPQASRGQFAIPLMIESPEFDRLLEEASVDVISLMRQRALGLLEELRTL